MQLIQFGMQLIKSILVVKHFAAGFHLPGNPTDILTPMKHTVVDTTLDIAHLASGNSTDIVANVLISDSTIIDAGTDDACITSGNPTDIRYTGYVFSGEKIINSQQGNIEIPFFYSGIDTGTVNTAQNRAGVSPGDGTDPVITINNTLRETFTDDTGDIIIARNHTDIIAAI